MNNFTPEQLREKDAWVANLMELKPSPKPLSAVRQKNDDRYNVAYQPSELGWWQCQTGQDAENKNREQTMCIWEVAMSATTDPAASDALDDKIIKERLDYEIGYDSGEFYMKSPNSIGDIIEVSHPDKKICRVLFAEKLYSK